jgi:colicin import membrane protein
MKSENSIDTINYHQNIFPELGISLSIHIFIFCLIFAVHSIMNKGFFSKNNELIELNKKLQQSVRVDVVNLPEFTIEELKKLKIVPDNTNQEKMVNKKNDIQDLKVIDSKKKIDLGNMLNDFANQDVLKKEKKNLKIGKNSKKVKQKNEKSFSNKELSKLKSLVLEGNILNKSGTSTVGTEGEEQELSQFEKYVLSIPEQIRPNWKLPTYLMEQDLKCRVQVFINQQGKIINFKLIESSGTNEFDERAMNSIKSTEFLTKPDKQYLTTLLTKGVVLGFPL